MSIVGAQSVSMSDLMKLGIPALNAMAQGQQQSIAPSYMVISALKALTDQQNGMAPPMPQGTVKDQVVAATQPTQAAPGIAGLQQQMPVQGMAEGGPVTGSYLGRSQGSNLLPNVTGFEGMTITELLAALAEKAKSGYSRVSDYVGGLDDRMKSAVRGTSATAPEMALLPIPAIDIAEQGAPDAPTPPQPPQAPSGGGSASVRMSSSSRGRTGGGEGGSGAGIGSVGGNPVSKYRDLNKDPLTPKELAEIEDLDIPVNEYLRQQMAKYGTPDEKRMAELAAEEERAGLSAFSRGMLNTKNGTGFGAVFGTAAADYSDAKTSRADQRRAYEDKREDIARQLALAAGQEQRDNFAMNQRFKETERSFDYGRQKDNRNIEDNAIKEGNQNTKREFDMDMEKQKLQIDRQRLALMSQAQALSAQVRKDGLNASNQAKIERLYQTAKEIAIKEAESIHGKTEMLDGSINPQKEAAKQRTMENAFEREYSRLNAIFGRSDGAPSPAAGVSRGTYGQ